MPPISTEDALLAALAVYILKSLGPWVVERFTKRQEKDEEHTRTEINSLSAAIQELAKEMRSGFDRMMGMYADQKTNHSVLEERVDNLAQAVKDLDRSYHDFKSQMQVMVLKGEIK